MLQKKSSELDNTTLKFRLMAEKNPDFKAKYDSLNKAKVGLATFLESYASHITSADLATEGESIESLKAASDELEKMNGQAETHLRGVRACLKEASNA